MKEHHLMRAFGKRRWTISAHDSAQEAYDAAAAHVALNGHLYPTGTRLYVESNVHIGFVYGCSIVEKWTPPRVKAYKVDRVVTGYGDHWITL